MTLGTRANESKASSLLGPDILARRILSLASIKVRNQGDGEVSVSPLKGQITTVRQDLRPKNKHRYQRAQGASERYPGN